MNSDDLEYILGLVRQYRAEAEAIRKGAEDSRDYRTFLVACGKEEAYARMEGHLEGRLEVKKVFARTNQPLKTNGT